MRVAALHAPLISLHGAIEAEEIGVLAIGLGKDAVALGVALAAKRFGLRIGLGEQDRHVAVRPGADFLALLAPLGAEIGRFALPFGLHALVDRLAVLLGKIDAADAGVDNVDAERLRVAVGLTGPLPLQILPAAAAPARGGGADRGSAPSCPRGGCAPRQRASPRRAPGAGPNSTGSRVAHWRRPGRRSDRISADR